MKVQDLPGHQISCHLWELHLPYNREQKLQEGLAVLPVTAGVPGCSQCQENQDRLQRLAALGRRDGHSPGTQLFLVERYRWPETEGIWGVVSDNVTKPVWCGRPGDSSWSFFRPTGHSKGPPTILPAWVACDSGLQSTLPPSVRRRAL